MGCDELGERPGERLFGASEQPAISLPAKRSAWDARGVWHFDVVVNPGGRWA